MRWLERLKRRKEAWLFKQSHFANPSRRLEVEGVQLHCESCDCPDWYFFKKEDGWGWQEWESFHYNCARCGGEVWVATFRYPGGYCVDMNGDTPAFSAPRVIDTGRKYITVEADRLRPQYAPLCELDSCLCDNLVSARKDTKVDKVDHTEKIAGLSNSGFDGALRSLLVRSAVIDKASPRTKEVITTRTITPE